MLEVISFIITFLISFLMTWLGVELFRRQALKNEIFDLPNERSSHKTPVPRGGGIVVIIIFAAFYLLNNFYQGAAINWSYLTAVAMLAAVSFYDDLKTIPIAERMIVHCAAAALIIWQNGFFEAAYLPVFGNVNFGIWGVPLTFLWIVWLINAYNFMDGIDGIASAQAMVGGLGWLFAAYFLQSSSGMLFSGLLISTAAGFFLHNRSPAKVFMGDAGSVFLGFNFAVLPLLIKNEAGSNRNILLITALLMIWFFVFDTFLTFLKRLLKGKKVWRAHREHLYQKLTDKRFSPQKTVIIYALSAICVEIPTVLGLARDKIFLTAGVCLAILLSAVLIDKENKIG